MELKLCYIKDAFFEEHQSLVKILDPGKLHKQSRRTHLCVEIDIDNNKYYIPLRNNLGKPIRKYGRIGHAIPSQKRPNAGLDYRYALVINDERYIESPEEQRIPNSQYRIIKNDYKQIKHEFETYVRGFKKAVKKKRVQKEPLYRESSLINFIY